MSALRLAVPGRSTSSSRAAELPTVDAPWVVHAGTCGSLVHSVGEMSKHRTMTSPCIPGSTPGVWASRYPACMAILLAVVTLLSGCTQTGPRTISIHKPKSVSVHQTTIAEVQTKAAAFNGGESMKVTGLRDITKGDGLVVGVFAESGDLSDAYPTVTSVTGGGVTFSLSATYQSHPYPNFTMDIWVGTDSSGGQTVVTADFGGGALIDGAVFVGEFSGLASAPYDASASSVGSAPETTYRTPSLTPSAPDELFWAVGRWPNVMGTTPAGPWSGLISGTDHSLVSLWTIPTGASAQQGIWTNDGEEAEDITLLACFKAAVAN